MSSMWHWFLRGLPFGLANILPGISGGTIALLLGYYDEMTAAIKTLKLRVLLPLAAGVATSILIGSWLIMGILEAYPYATRALLLGFILASAWSIRPRNTEKRQPSLYSLTVLGAVAAWLMAGGSAGLDTASGHILILFVVGVVSSAAMLVPGISGASVLLLLGYYEFILQAVKQLDFSILVPMAMGIAVGVIALATLMNYLLTRYSAATYALLSGLVLGSARLVMVPPSPLHGLLLLSGLAAAYWLGPRRDGV